MYISRGGSSYDVTINSSGYVEVGGYANNTIINSDGLLYILTGGSANNTTVNKLAYVYISSGGTATAIRENGGYVSVSYGAYAAFVSNSFSGVVLSNYQSASLHSATTAIKASVFGSARIDIRGGTAISATVNSGGSLLVYSGTANNTLLNSSGSAVVHGNGTANSTTVASRGYLYLYSSGTANDTMLNSGGSVAVNGGTANSTTVNFSGQLGVVFGGITNNTTVSSGGQLYVSSGGTANSTMVSGGYMYISSGGTATNIVWTPCEWRVYVSEGGYAMFVSQYSGVYYGSGNQLLSHENELNGKPLSGSWEMYVMSGGTANSTTVNSNGRVYISSDGILTGQTTIESGAVISMYEGAILDFDLTQTSAGAASLVNDLSIIQDAPIYTLTVDGKQVNGTYKLAEGAAGFDKTITVVNTERTSLGTLFVGQTTSIGGADYTLNLNDSLLSVTLSGAEPPPPTPGTKPAKFDADGNGVSDVMFVWTGYNYAHGYWMNGDANDWQSTYAVHPAEWENLGCYDMNGDGKADSVLVGNIELETGKGAYMGYYLNGEDSDANWVNIDFLNNEAEVVWKNKVGNLTGNANANSIIWYAPDMYTVGAWLDGTSQWALLSGDFGGDFWQMVGCGDFDGDGKDSVLMSGGNGQMLYSVGLDGVAVSHGSANWSGWEVRAIGDFAGDGKDDIVLFHSTLGAMALLIDGNADDYVSLGQLDPFDWFVVGAGDYNNDQKDDLLVRQKTTGMLGYYNACDTSESGWVEMGRGVDLNWTVIA